MPETKSTFLTLRVAGWARSFGPEKPVSLGAHRYCNVLLPPGEGETPLRAAVFQWKAGAWVLSNSSKRHFMLRTGDEPALSLPPGGSVALAGAPFILTVTGASAAVDVEVSTSAIDGAALPASTEAPPWEPDPAGRADLALFSPWAADDPVAAEPAPRPSPPAAWVPLTSPPVESERIAFPAPAAAVWGFPPATPAPARRGRRGSVTALLVAIILVAGAAGAAALRWPGAGPVAPPHPAQWDPRLADIVSFVENERGLKFEHPVFVDYLPSEAFRKTVTGDSGPVSPAARRAMDQTLGFFRALGLVEGTPDLFGGANQLNGDGTLAFYDPTDQRVRVRGTELTEAVKATLAHELTHALQDQYFGLSRMGQKGDAADRFRAVVEGDAMRVETRWVDHLDPAARKAHDAVRATEAKGADFSTVPEVLTVLFSAPYDLGEPFVELLQALGGNPAVDRALKSPPASEEQLLDPFRYLAGDSPLRVKEPALQKGETRVDGGEFGAYGLFLTLAQRLAPKEALQAVDGWGGDSYVQFDRGGHSCVRVDFVGDNAQETDQLTGSLEGWARAMPSGAASVARHDSQVELTSCDPGAGAKIGGRRLADAVTWPLMRTYATVGAIQAGLPQDTARCYSEAILKAYTPAQLTSLPSAAEQRRLGKLAAAACGHP